MGILNGFMNSRGNYSLRYAAREAFFSKYSYNSSEILFVGLVDEFCCGRPLLAHTHVKRAVVTKRKTARCIINLR